MADMEVEMVRWILSLLGLDNGCGIDPNGCRPAGSFIDPIGG